jgi:PAS domain S-box-containing protein
MNEDLSHKELLQKVSELEQEAVARKQAEAKLKKQTEFLNLVLESLSHPFYVIDAHTYSIKLANAAALEKRSIAKPTCYALSHKQDAPCDSSEHPCPLEIIKKTKKPVRVEHIHYDQKGDPRHVEVHAYPIFDEEGQVAQIIEYTLDISDRKAIEAALKESERKFRAVAESAKDAVISADKNGNVVFWNPAAQDMFGYKADEIMGQPLTRLMPEKFRIDHQKGMARHAQTDQAGLIDQTVEKTGLTKEGLEFPIELSLSTWKAGEETFYTGIIRDISDRKRREKERDALIKNLQQSLATVKKLSGLLPICASCKKIRDDKGYWNQIEAYIREHSEAEFSHGICPECSQKLYPEYHQRILQKRKNQTKFGK